MITLQLALHWRPHFTSRDKAKSGKTIRSVPFSSAKASEWWIGATNCFFLSKPNAELYWMECTSTFLCPCSLNRSKKKKRNKKNLMETWIMFHSPPLLCNGHVVNIATKGLQMSFRHIYQINGMAFLYQIISINRQPAELHSSKFS